MLIRKTSITLIFMTSQPGLQIIAIHILPYITKERQPDNEIRSINRI